MPYEQPEYLTGLQNAALAYMQGLQERRAREREDSLRREQDERLKQNFLRDLYSRQAQEGDIGSAQRLDEIFGTKPQIPENFGNLRQQTPNVDPASLNQAQLKIMNMVNTIQGTPFDQENKSPEFTEAQKLLHSDLESAQNAVLNKNQTFAGREKAIAAYNTTAQKVQNRMRELRQSKFLPTQIPHPSQRPEQSSLSVQEQAALTGHQRDIEQRNLAGLPTGESNSAFAGPFERYAAEQRAKTEKADREKQLQLKRASDEKYFEDIDRAILEGRVSPGDATKYFSAKRDYVSGKTQELPSISLREKAQDKQDRTDAVRNRRTNMLLMATSRLDDKIGSVDGELGKLETWWEKQMQESPDRADAITDNYMKRKRELDKQKKDLAKRRTDLEKSLDAVMQDEGIPTFGGDENNAGEDIKKRGAKSLYDQLLSMGVDEQSARDRVIADYDYDPIAGEFVPLDAKTPEQMYKKSAPRAGGRQANDRAAKAKALLDQKGFESDENAINTFLRNNPSFK